MSKRLTENEEDLEKSVKIAIIKDERRRFATLAQVRRHEANAAIKAAASEVLAVREEIKHCMEEAANTVAEAVVTVKNNTCRTLLPISKGKGNDGQA